MQNITLICTRHQECGSCNSNALHGIIEKLRPEIIFEELSLSNFDKIYHEESFDTVETKAVKDYLENHSIEHIPVDTCGLSSTYHSDIDSMYHKLFNSSAIKESHDLRNLVDNQLLWINQHGFIYLNSNQSDKFFDAFEALKDRILDSLNDEKLFQIARLERETIQRRENEMINNIYNYSERRIYNQGLFFIGSGHRRSIIKKIQEANMRKTMKLHWTIIDRKLK